MWVPNTVPTLIILIFKFSLLLLFCDIPDTYYFSSFTLVNTYFITNVPSVNKAFNRLNGPIGTVLKSRQINET